MPGPTPDDIKELRDKFVHQLCADEEAEMLMRHLHAKVRMYAAAAGLEIGDEGQGDRAENEIEEFEHDCLFAMAELFVVVFVNPREPRMRLSNDGG